MDGVGIESEPLLAAGELGSRASVLLRGGMQRLPRLLFWGSRRLISWQADLGVQDQYNAHCGGKGAVSWFGSIGWSSSIDQGAEGSGKSCIVGFHLGLEILIWRK
jgi:hypothetical protein